MVSELARVKAHLRIARRAGQLATLSLTEWEQTIADFNGMCAYCLSRPYKLLEHFVPVTVAGTTVNNCIPACDDCNKKKRNHTGDKLIEIFGHATIEHIQAYLMSRSQKPDKPTTSRRKPVVKVQRVYYVVTKAEYDRMVSMGRKVVLW